MKRQRSHRMKAAAVTVATPWLLACLAACTGTIGGSNNQGGQNESPTTSGTAGSGAGGGGGGSGSAASGAQGAGAAEGGSSAYMDFACTSTSPDPGPTSILLLTRAQYLNTLQGLFGTVVPDLTTALGPDDSYQTPAFGLVQADVDVAALQSYQAAAEAIAAAVVASSTTLSAIDPCTAGTAARTCAQSFVQNFGSLAYRAPVTDPADIARHMVLYDVGASTSNAHGIELVLRGMLQSPRFLYRVEVGTTEQVSPTAVKLSGYEIAARLSYDLWNAPPDATLTQAAATGALTTKAQVSAQLTRMLQDPKGTTIVRSFLEGLTQIAALPYAVKDPTMFPEWNAAGSTLPASMQGQAQAFFDDVLNNQGGTLDALLTSPKVFVNADLASYYGVTGGSTFQPLQLDPTQASGLLTLPALMTLMAKPDESWPIYRGQYVRESLLCQQLPSPPPNIPPPPAVEAGVSTRERLTEHETLPSCASCHTLMDPIGFGFENFDAVGRYRTTDGNQPVDASGYIVSTEDINGTFNGVSQLASKLVQSVQVQECLPQQWFRFMMSRFEQAPDNCSMRSIINAFQAAGTSLNSLPQALVQSDAFLYRRPITPNSDAGTSDGSAGMSP
jgi:Protein of unknown function (DUF1592)/Protein of unknown function (DUF1588)/Protein of unknown function (DUF1595)/Protein of unknown function (DUF1585)/Protein of unknown function (DUF1587)